MMVIAVMRLKMSMIAVTPPMIAAVFSKWAQSLDPAAQLSVTVETNSQSQILSTEHALPVVMMIGRLSLLPAAL